MRRSAPLVLLLLLALALPASAQTAPPDITDPTGDANALNGQGLVTGGAADGTATPASYARADLTAVRFETAYTTTPVGDDGVRHTATGLRARITTAGIPGSDGPTLIYRLNTTVGACGGFLQAYLRGPAAGPTDQADGRLEWRQFASRGCTADATVFDARFTATVEGNDLVLEFPFAALSGADRTNMAVGKTITGTIAEVRVLAGVLTAPAIDITPAAAKSFRIGSDVPADVPCTSGCPS
jgi:hypothetical protein